MEQVHINYKGKKYKNYYKINAVMNDKSIGGAKFVYLEEENRVWVISLKVKDGKRSMNAGSMILKHIENKAIELGAKVVEGTFEPKGILKSTLERFYRKNAFAVLGDSKIFKKIGDQSNCVQVADRIFRGHKEIIHNTGEIEYEEGKQI